MTATPGRDLDRRRAGMITLAGDARRPGRQPRPPSQAPDPQQPAGHPGPLRATLPSVIRDAIVAHARAEQPNESCGLVAGTGPAADGGIAATWHAGRNRAASPLRYELHPDDLLRITLEVDDAREVIWAIVHSHVRSPARPSPTDVASALYPDALYLVVSLDEREADPASGAESLRAWRILEGDVHEVELAIADD